MQEKRRKTKNPGWGGRRDGAGRKSLPDAGRYVLSLRVSEADRERIRAAAASAGMTVSRYLSARILGSADGMPAGLPPQPPAPETSASAATVASAPPPKQRRGHKGGETPATGAAETTGSPATPGAGREQGKGV